MIPAAGFSLNDFFATARFALTVYNHIQFGHSAPQNYLDFRNHILDFGNGLQHLAEILQEHERHLFNSGAKARGTVDNTSRVQRTLSEVVGDFKTLQENTEKFLRHYKFMIVNRKGGGWAWKKVRVYSAGSAMFSEMEALKREYLFHTAKVNIVVEPLRILLLKNLETTLYDVQKTVNRIEQIARSLYAQTPPESCSASGVYESVPEDSVPMSRESSSGYGVPPPGGYRFKRTDTSLSDASTFVASPIVFNTRKMTPPGTNGDGYASANGSGSASASGSSTAVTATASEWVWLHEQFGAALARSVGLEQTKLGVVLDEIVKWLEEGRRGVQSTRPGEVIDVIPFVHLCKASWLCAKLLSSHQYQALDAHSLWHPYITKIAESIFEEFESLKALRLKLPNIKTLRPPLPVMMFDLGLPPACIGSPGLLGVNTWEAEREIIKMNLPGYGEMEREVTVVDSQDGDTIRVKDKVGKGTEWTVTPSTLKRNKTTIHPSIPFMQSSGMLQRPHLRLKNSDDSVSVGFEFSDYKQLGAFQSALMGYKIVSQIKQVGRLTCYYHSSKTFRAKTDVYDQTSVQIWHEQRAHYTSMTPRPRQASAYSTSTSISGGGGGRALTVPTGMFDGYTGDTTRAYRTHSQNSANAGSASVATSDTSSSSVGSSRGSHTVKTKEAKVERSPESTKLVIFARPAGGNARADISGVEILVMEIDPYTSISRESCCTRRKPEPDDKHSPLCCLRVWIEKVPFAADGGKSLRLLGFREPEQDTRRGDIGIWGGPLGPGLPLNVDAWSENKSRSQKVESLGIEFNTEMDKRYFIKDFEDMQLLASPSAETYR